MNATLAIDNLSRAEQLHLLQRLVDRLYPETKQEHEEAFPDWVMKELEEQEVRVKAGLEKSEPGEVVRERLDREFLRRRSSFVSQFMRTCARRFFSMRHRKKELVRPTSLTCLERSANSQISQVLMADRVSFIVLLCKNITPLSSTF